MSRSIVCLTAALFIQVLMASPAALSASNSAGPDTGPRQAILVTGATSGIGRNLAERLAREGYFVYAGARKESDITALNEIENIQALRLDVTVQEDIDNAVEIVRKQGRGLYGLVNNAGVTVFGPLIETSEKDMQFQMDVNLFGPYRVTKAFAPLIIESKGRIVTTGSVAGTFGAALLGPYNMSKFAVEGFTEALAQEMKKFGVGVSIIEPGNYRSDIIRAMNHRMEKGDEEGTSQYASEKQKLFHYFTHGRTGLKAPDEVAEAMMDALFSARPQLRYMVVPNHKEAESTIRKAVERLVQLNGSQSYSYRRDELIVMLDEALTQMQGRVGDQI